MSYYNLPSVTQSSFFMDISIIVENFLLFLNILCLKQSGQATVVLK